MDSLQTLAIKGLLDKYTWDIPSLLSIGNKIGSMIETIKINQLRDFYELSDTDGKFTEQLKISMINRAEFDDKLSSDNNEIIVKYGNIEYQINASDDIGYMHYLLKISTDAFSRIYSFKHAFSGCHSDIYHIDNIEYIINNDNKKFPEDILLYGLFLWKYYNIHCYKCFYCEEPIDENHEIYTPTICSY